MSSSSQAFYDPPVAPQHALPPCLGRSGHPGCSQSAVSPLFPKPSFFFLSQAPSWALSPISRPSPQLFTPPWNFCSPSQLTNIPFLRHHLVCSLPPPSRFALPAFSPGNHRFLFLQSRNIPFSPSCDQYSRFLRSFSPLKTRKFRSPLPYSLLGTSIPPRSPFPQAYTSFPLINRAQQPPSTPRLILLSSLLWLPSILLNYPRPRNLHTYIRSLAAYRVRLGSPASSPIPSSRLWTESPSPYPFNPILSSSFGSVGSPSLN